MATQTTNYGLTKPAWDDMADVSVLNNNSDIIDAQMYANETMAAQSVANMADAYDATATYAEGDYCTYGGKLYQANTDISVAEAFDATHWDETTAAEHFSDGGGGGSYEVHYSTTEQAIGTWIDGSTLYQITNVYQNVSVSSNNYITLESAWGMELVHAFGFIEENGGRFALPETSIRISVSSSGDLELTSKTSNWSGDLYVTLQYTKPTTP